MCVLGLIKDALIGSKRVILVSNGYHYQPIPIRKQKDPTRSFSSMTVPTLVVHFISSTYHVGVVVRM